MATQKGARIVKTPNVLGGRPRIEGRRISVDFVRTRVEKAGIDPHKVATEHDLDVADVYRALAYYHENPAEMEEVESERNANEERAMDRPDVVTGPDDLTGRNSE